MQYCGIPDDGEVLLALLAALGAALAVAGGLAMLLAPWRHGSSGVRRFGAHVWIASVGFAAWFATMRGVGGPCIFAGGHRRSQSISYEPMDSSEALWLGLGVGLFVGVIWAVMIEYRRSAAQRPG